ncbi:MAG: glycosyltransferase family 2 protein [Candidatus Nitronauta litoralis]|uniref:Glycosyltransferase family 2 protein n=1 Tax=Candidatus Nitronauta litoralis TaxID=2705533 RepID=A0A7T0BWI6_9BACT|nr:MAG: glycosyltransferase family 2 protein [Candidatus Nitronauta litoralis]
MQTDTVAVIIVNYNAGKHLTRCLEALGRQTRKPDRILLIDNASTDSSLDGITASWPDVEIFIQEKNTGFAAANNFGIAKADNCEWVALLNPDAFADPDWLERLMDATQAYAEDSFFGSRMLCHGQRDRLDGTGDVYHASGVGWRRDHGFKVSEGHMADEIFSPCAAAALYKRQAILDAEGFDEDFFCYFEDVDLGFRLRLLGHRGRYIPEAIVEHVGWGTTTKSSDFSIYHGHRNLVWAYFKNMPGPLFWKFLPLHLIWNFIFLIVFSLRGQPGAIWKAKCDALLGLPAVMDKRQRVQSKIKVNQKRLLPVIDCDALAPYRQFRSRKINGPKK